MKLKRNDIILAVCLMVVAAIVLIIIKTTQTPGGSAVVTVDGKQTAVYSLDENRDVRLGTEQIGNTLVIKDGYVYISDASCPDKLCKRQGKICFEGQTIVCLPNRTVITIESTKPSKTDFIQ